MKRIIAAVAVVAVVSGALAFAPKKGTQFCASTTQNSNCAVITKTQVAGTANFFIDPNFNGTNCTASNCATAVRLVDED